VGDGGREVAQIMYTHVSKCKFKNDNNKIKIKVSSPKDFGVFSFLYTYFLEKSHPLL
jgi:hypothetical protein